jgi:hypothetical protein
MAPSTVGFFFPDMASSAHQIRMDLSIPWAAFPYNAGGATLTLPLHLDTFADGKANSDLTARREVRKEQE